MLPFSVLDLSPIPEGGTAADALANTLDLARHAEAWGYRRFWLAEHHNMPGIASAATAVVIGHVAAGTRTIRVGAGGIMLPNHAPLTVAEAFGTLATLYPGRIDLGLGRAPGTDMATTRALRRHIDGGDRFPQDVVELLGYLGRARPARAGCGRFPGRAPGCRSGSSARASTGRSSRRTSGCPTPSPRTSRRKTSRRRSRSTARASGRRPAGGAAADARVQRLRRRQRRRGAPAPLVDAAGLRQPPDRQPRAAAAAGRGHRGAGSTRGRWRWPSGRSPAPPSGRRRRCGARSRPSSTRHEPDELILTGQIHDHAARLRSFEIAAEVLADGSARAGVGGEPGAQRVAAAGGEQHVVDAGGAVGRRARPRDTRSSRGRPAGRAGSRRSRRCGSPPGRAAPR